MQNAQVDDVDKKGGRQEVAQAEAQAEAQAPSGLLGVAPGHSSLSHRPRALG